MFWSNRRFLNVAKPEFKASASSLCICGNMLTIKKKKHYFGCFIEHGIFSETVNNSSLINLQKIQPEYIEKYDRTSWMFPSLVYNRGFKLNVVIMISKPKYVFKTLPFQVMLFLFFLLLLLESEIIVQFRKCLIQLFTGSRTNPETTTQRSSDRRKITVESQTGEMSAIATSIPVAGTSSQRSDNSETNCGSPAQLPIPENKVCPM